MSDVVAESIARRRLNQWCHDRESYVVHSYSSVWCEYPNGRSYWAFEVELGSWDRLNGKYGFNVYEDEVTLVGEMK